MPLGMEVGLGPGHVTWDPPPKGANPNFFSSTLLTTPLLYFFSFVPALVLEQNLWRRVGTGFFTLMRSASCHPTNSVKPLKGSSIVK